MCRQFPKVISMPILLMYVVSATGCYVWTPITIAPPPDPMPGDVRVDVDRRQWIRMENPRIEGDAIMDDDYRRVPLADIRAIEARKLSWAWTTVGIAVTVGALVGVGVALADELTGWDIGFGDP
jgi:hypothetical protein